MGRGLIALPPTVPGKAWVELVGLVKFLPLLLNLVLPCPFVWLVLFLYFPLACLVLQSTLFFDLSCPLSLPCTSVMIQPLSLTHPLGPFIITYPHTPTPTPQTSIKTILSFQIQKIQEIIIIVEGGNNTFSALTHTYIYPSESQTSPRTHIVKLHNPPTPPTLKLNKCNNKVYIWQTIQEHNFLLTY